MARTLRRRAGQRLAMLDELAQNPRQQIPLVRAEIQRMTRGWRELLTAHLPDDKGRCPECRGWIRRRRWPCPVWRVAYQRLVGDEHEQSAAAAALPGRTVRARDVEVIPRSRKAESRADSLPVQADAEPVAQPRSASAIHRAAVTESRVTTRSLQANARGAHPPTA